MNPSSTRLHFHGDATALRFDGGYNVTLPVGPAGLARNALRHDPPTPAELENAIDLVELGRERAPPLM